MNSGKNQRKRRQYGKILGLIAMRLGVAAVCMGVAVLLNRTVLNGIFFEGAAALMLILPPPCPP